jgi:hypothetical protein
MRKWELLGWVLFIGLCWPVFRYYWLRVIVCTLALLLWGGATIAVPIFMRYVRDGSFVTAFVALS